MNEEIAKLNEEIQRLKAALDDANDDRKVLQIELGSIVKGSWRGLVYEELGVDPNEPFRSMLRKLQELRWEASDARQLRVQNRELETANRKLEESAIVDVLRGALGLEHANFRILLARIVYLQSFESSLPENQKA